MASADIVNVADLIDRRPISAVQVGVVLLCGCINLLDGMDSQSIGVAAPLIAASLGLKLSSFGLVFSAAQLGAAVGALTFGMVGDRLGRKTHPGLCHDPVRRLHAAHRACRNLWTRFLYSASLPALVSGAPRRASSR